MIQLITSPILEHKIILAFLAPFYFEEANGQLDAIAETDFDTDEWKPASPDEYVGFTKGSAVFKYQAPASLKWKVAGRSRMKHAVEKILIRKANAYFSRDVRLNLIDWHLIGMKNRIIISTLLIEITCPWDFFLKRFPQIRDPFSTNLRDAIVSRLARLEKKEKTKLSFPYFHTLISGKLNKAIDRAVLNHSFRQILYPETNAPIKSASPDPTEFIFLGYAFSLILCPDSPLQRTLQVLPLIEYTSSLYSELADASSAAEMKILKKEFKKDTEIQDVKDKLRLMYYGFVSPTFTYTHEMLVLRDRLLETWRVDKLLNRAEFLVSQLEFKIKESQKNRENRWARYINILLFVITLSTLVSVVYDATMMARTFDFLKTAAVEAWENISIK